jgi:hypothetical protein
MRHFPSDAEELSFLGGGYAPKSLEIKTPHRLFPASGFNVCYQFVSAEQRTGVD